MLHSYILDKKHLSMGHELCWILNMFLSFVVFFNKAYVRGCVVHPHNPIFVYFATSSTIITHLESSKIKQFSLELDIQFTSSGISDCMRILFIYIIELDQELICDILLPILSFICFIDFFDQFYSLTHL